MKVLFVNSGEDSDYTKVLISSVSPDSNGSPLSLLRTPKKMILFVIVKTN